MLRVEDGKIVSNEERIIDTMCAIIETEVGFVYKFGDAEDGKIEDYYKALVDAYNSVGLVDFAKAYKYISFKNSELDLEEIKIFINYGISVSASEIFLSLVKSLENNDINEFKCIIKSLKELGF